MNRRAWIAMCALVIACVCVAAGATPARALDGWSSEQISAAAGGASLGDMAPDFVVWAEAAEQGGSQVVLYSIALGDTLRLGDAGNVARHPRVEGGWVVWQEAEAGGAPEIFLYDISTASTVQLTNNQSADEFPVVSVTADGPRVAWVGRPAGVATLFAYEHASGETQAVSDNVARADSVRLSGARAVWTGWAGAGTQTAVFSCDLAAGATTRLSADGRSAWEPALEGDLAAWSEREGSDVLLMLHDFATGETSLLSRDGSWWNENPSIGEGAVAWNAGPGDDLAIKYRQVNTGRQTDTEAGSALGEASILTAAWTRNQYPVIDAGIAVWQGWDGHDDEIFVHDLSAGTTTQLTNNSWSDWRPHTAAGRVAWQGYQAGHGEIMLAERMAAPNSPFADVSGTSPFRFAVQALWEEGIVSGYPGTDGPEFRAEQNLYRAQFAKLIVGVVGLAVDEGLPCPFLDLGPDDPDSLYPHEYVAAAFRAGLVKGVDAAHFDPYGRVTRGQAITMAVRAAGYRELHLASPAEDFPELSGEYPSPHTDNISRAMYNGLLGGLVTGDSGWNPWFLFSRGEAALLLWNLAEAAAPFGNPTVWGVGTTVDVTRFTTRQELEAYIDAQEALLSEHAAATPYQTATVALTFRRVLTQAEVEDLLRGRDVAITAAGWVGTGSGHAGLAAGETLSGLADRIARWEWEIEDFSIDGYEAIEVEGRLGELLGFLEDAEVAVVDPGALEEALAARREGRIRSTGFPPLFYAYQRLMGVGSEDITLVAAGWAQGYGISDDYVLYGQREPDPVAGSHDVLLNLYDMETGSVTEVARVTTPGSIGFGQDGYLQPQLDERRVVWCAPVGTSREVFLYDLTARTTTQLTDNAVADFKPHVAGNLVTWLSGTEESADVIVHDLRTGATRKVASGVQTNLGYGGNGVSVSPEGAPTDGRFVVWWKTPPGVSQIMLYDAETGMVTNLSGQSEADAGPQIADGHLVWLRFLFEEELMQIVGCEADGAGAWRVITEATRTAPVTDPLTNGREAVWFEYQNASGGSDNWIPRGLMLAEVW